MLMSYRAVTLLGLSLAAVSLLTGCKKPPPDYRSEVTLPVFSGGDADKGELVFDDACAQCHQLKAGSNKKGPQLMNVYGAPAAQLKDYKYSQALSQSGWVWDANTLDHYIADVDKAIPDSKMLADPMPDARERADVIAYLSTLREVPPKIVEGEASDIGKNTEKDTGKSPSTAPSKMQNTPVEIVDGETPAANYQR